MGTIVEKRLANGQLKYKAVVRLKKADLGNFSSSRTFSKKSLATAWMKKVESDFAESPAKFFQQREDEVVYPTLKETIESYIEKNGKNFARTKTSALRHLAKYPIGEIPLDQLKGTDIYNFAEMRRTGEYSAEGKPLNPSTIKKDLAHLKVVLKNARRGRGFNILDTLLEDLDGVIEELFDARIIGRGTPRDRLPTSDELQRLTSFFYKNWRRKAGTTPMHLVMWFAITSGRRQAEICSLKFINLKKSNNTWLVENLKDPNQRKIDRLMKITPECMEVIEEVLKPDTRERMLELGYSDQLLFPLDSKTIGTYFTRACHILDIEGLRFHDLRHEAATRYAEDGFTVPQLEQITLHTSWNTLRRYVNIHHREDRLIFKKAMEVAEKEFDDWYGGFSERQRYIAKIDYIEAAHI